jgi:hypothetical protein
LSTTTSTYLSIENNLARYQKMVASEPTVKTATDYYAANIGKVTSISDLVGNYRLLSYALTAYGLGDQVNNKALVTKVLEGGVTSSKALANTLSNPNWAKFAKAFDFVGSTSASSISTSARSRPRNRTMTSSEARIPGRASRTSASSSRSISSASRRPSVRPTTCSATRTCSRRSRPSSA